MHDVLASAAAVLDRDEVVVVSYEDGRNDATDQPMGRVIGDVPDAALFQLAPPCSVAFRGRS